MKTIFTLLLASFILIGKNTTAQSCDTPTGGNGSTSAFTGGITIDGNMSDWAAYLNDPDNNTYDGTGTSDLDAPISDAGRDLVRFTFTEDANHLYFYLQRAGSSSNTVDIVFYLDVNNNDLMEFGEPVYHINWSGSNGNVSVQVQNYQPSLLSILVNTLTQNLDGKKLMGTLGYRGNQGSGSSSGKGSADGRSIEVKIPFSQITRVNILGGVVDQLHFGENFKFHVSTINGNISSIPGINSINDNFGGCLKAPTAITVLPVKLESFNAFLSSANKVDLKWVTTSEINTSHFVVERSFDGSSFNETATVFASGNADSRMNYAIAENIASVSSPVIYYRLRSVDVDGKTSYSAVRIIRLNKTTANTVSILTYPNPASNELRVTIPANWQNKKVVYEILAANGQTVQKFENTTSSQTESLNISKLHSGFYMIRVACEGETAQQKIIKQ
jgi:hypothetical protein